MKLIVITTIIFLLVVPMSLALDVTQVEFLSYGKPIGDISNNPIQHIDLNVTITGSDFSSLRADLSGITNEFFKKQAYKLKVPTTGCQKQSDNTTFFCIFRELELKIPAPTVNMTFSLYDTNNSVTLLNKTHTFSIDNTKPQVVNAKTDTCDDNNTCYISSNRYANVTIDFQDSKATFNHAIVTFHFAGKLYHVSNCVGMTCYRRLKISCNSGQIVPLKILKTGGHDDAYNTFNNSLTTYIVCDNDPPVIGNITIGTQNNEYVKIGDTMIVSVNATDNLGDISVEGNFSEFGGGIEKGDCKKSADNITWNCNISLKVIGDQPYVGTAHLILKDTAGNELVKEISKNVLGLDSEIVVDEWQAGTIEGMPGLLNTDVVQHTTSDVKVYYKVPLSPKFQDLKILDMHIKSCTAKQNTTNIFNTDAFKLMNKKTTTPFIVGTILNKRYDPGTYDYDCSLQIRSKKGQFYHLNYEIENVTISISLAAGGNAKSAIKEEVYGVLDDWLLSSEYATFSGIVNMLRTTCGAVKTFTHGVTVVNAGYSAIASSLDAAAVTPPGKAVEKGFKESVQTTNDANTGVLAGIGYEACAIASCDTTFNKGGQIMRDTLCALPAVDALEQVSGSKCRDLVSGKRSIFVAMASLCAPDMIIHLDNLKSIKLNYAQCLVDGYRANVPIYTCQETQSFLTCKFWAGQFVNTIPYTALLKDTLTKVKNIISDPYAMLSLGIPAACAVGKWTGLIDDTSTIRSICLTVAKAGEAANIITNMFTELVQTYNSVNMGTYDTQTQDSLRNSMDTFDKNG